MVGVPEKETRPLALQICYGLTHNGGKGASAACVPGCAVDKTTAEKLWRAYHDRLVRVDLGDKEGDKIFKGLRELARRQAADGDVVVAKTQPNHVRRVVLGRTALDFLSHIRKHDTADPVKMECRIGLPGRVDPERHICIFSPFKGIVVGIVALAWLTGSTPAVGGAERFEIALDVVITPDVDGLAVQALCSLATRNILEAALIIHVQLVIHSMVLLSRAKHAIKA